MGTGQNNVPSEHFSITFIFGPKCSVALNFNKLSQKLRPKAWLQEHLRDRQAWIDYESDSKWIDLIKSTPVSSSSGCRKHPHKLNIPLYNK